MAGQEQVTLDAELLDALRRVAEQQGRSPDELVEGLVRRFLRRARREAIRQEYAAYARLHPELVATRLGEHVAIHSGQVVDHDAEPGALLRRVRRRFGHAPVLITQVSKDLAPEFIIRSPRLAAPAPRRRLAAAFQR